MPHEALLFRALLGQIITKQLQYEPLIKLEFHQSREMEKWSVLERDLLPVVRVDASGVKGTAQCHWFLCNRKGEEDTAS